MTFEPRDIRQLRGGGGCFSKTKDENWRAIWVVSKVRRDAPFPKYLGKTVSLFLNWGKEHFVFWLSCSLRQSRKQADRGMMSQKILKNSWLDLIFGFVKKLLCGVTCQTTVEFMFRIFNLSDVHNETIMCVYPVYPLFHVCSLDVSYSFESLVSTL